MSSKNGARPAKEQAILRSMDDFNLYPAFDWAEILTGRPLAGVSVYDLRIKRTEGSEEPLLMVMKGFADDGTPVVAFQSGSNPIDMLASAARRIYNGSVKWRVDEWETKRRALGSGE